MFFIDEDVLRKGSYKLRMELEAYEKITAKGAINSSFNIVPARLLKLDYPDFLLLIYQSFGAELHGKGRKYISYSFKDKEKLKELVTILNTRWDKIYSN